MRRKRETRKVEVSPETVEEVAEATKIPPQRMEILGRRSALVVVSNAAIALEGIRIAAQVRLTHLAKREATCSYTEQILERAREFEGWADSELADLVRKHPAAPWFTHVRGTGGESIGKVLGHIEAFARFYHVGDRMIPDHIKRELVMVPIPVEGKQDEFIETPMIWVEGIERLTTPSKLRKLAGLLPGQKRETGKKLGFNAELRTMLWRLGTQLLRACGKYNNFYTDYRRRLENRLMDEGVRILPTPKGRFCPACSVECTVCRFRGSKH